MTKSGWEEVVLSEAGAKTSGGSFEGVGLGLERPDVVWCVCVCACVCVLVCACVCVER